MKKQGQFIILEGGEGAGKSTLVRNLALALEEQGVEVVVTREPGGSPKAEEVRRLILQREVGDNFAADAEMLLFYAARFQHLHDTILPALEAGKTVLCDRFEATTYSYQIFARNGDENLFQLLHGRVVDLLVPLEVACSYLHLQVPVEVARQRLATSGKTLPDVFDGREVEFHEATRCGYVAAKKALNPLFKHFDIDASQTPEEMIAESLRIIKVEK